jgi:hypothetical protein
MRAKSVALGVCICVVVANVTVHAAAGKDDVDRVGAATIVLNEMMRARDKAIPGSILEKAEAIVGIGAKAALARHSLGESE